MNILILNWRDVRHPKSGGAELVTMEHAKGWVASGNQVTWLTADYAGNDKKDFIDGVHMVRRAGSLTVYLYAWIYLLLNGRLVDIVVDEVHGFPFFSPLFTNRPVVVFIHEIAGEIWDYMFPFPKNVIGKFLERWYFYLYRHCYFWTDASSTVDELVARGIAHDHCIAIPCPMPVVKHPSTLHAVVKEKDPTYLFVSRVVRMKGVEEVIKAFSFIVRSQENAKLWIVGGGEDAYIHELKAMIQEYSVSERVTFFGSVPDNMKFALMKRAHLLLHASVKEGWGLVVLEAASVGTPSIVYNVPGLKDVVKHDKTGIVVFTNSPSDMAREAVTLINDYTRYREFQRNGAAWQKSIQWNNVIQQSLGVLKRAFSEHK